MADCSSEDGMSEEPSSKWQQKRTHTPKLGEQEADDATVKEQPAKSSSSVSCEKSDICCVLCHQTFPSTAMSKFRIHMRHCHSLQVLIQCQVCLQTFSETTRLNHHLCSNNATSSQEDEEEEDEEEDDNSVQSSNNRHVDVTKLNETCHLCSETFSTLYEINIHRWSTPGGKVYRCLTCSKMIGGLANLSEHIDSHSRRRSLRHKRQPKTEKKRKTKKVFRCDFCTNTFSNLSLTMEHRLNVHTNGISSLTCNCCGHVFPDSTFLGSHLAQPQCTSDSEQTDTASTCMEEDECNKSNKDNPNPTPKPFDAASPLNTMSSTDVSSELKNPVTAEKEKGVSFSVDSQRSEGMYQCEACRFTFNLGQCHVTESDQVICPSCDCILETVASELRANRLDSGMDKAGTKDSFRPMLDGLVLSHQMPDVAVQAEGYDVVKQHQECLSQSVEISDVDSENEDVTVLRCEGLNTNNGMCVTSYKHKDVDEEEGDDEDDGDDEDGGGRDDGGSGDDDDDDDDDDCAVVEVTIPDVKKCNDNKPTMSAAVINIDVVSDEENTNVTIVDAKQTEGAPKKTGRVGFKTKTKTSGITKSTLKKTIGAKLAKKLKISSKMDPTIKEDGQSTEKKIFQCDVCHLTFGSVTWIMRHRKNHAEVSFTCQNCKHVFSRSCELGHHLSKCHSGKPAMVVVADKVPKKVPKPEGSSKGQGKIYTCDFCFLSFASVSWVMRHRREHSRNISSYECQVCSKVYEKSSEFGRHLSVCTILKSKQLKSAETKPDVSLPKKESPKKRLSTEETPCTQDSSVSDTTAKKSSSEQERKFKCDYCWQLFASARWVIRHRKIHSSDPVCQFCFKPFEKSVELGKHLGTDCTNKRKLDNVPDTTTSACESDNAPDDVTICENDNTPDTTLCDSDNGADDVTLYEKDNTSEIAIVCESDNVTDDVILCENENDDDNNNNNNNKDNAPDVATLCNSIESIADSDESSATIKTDMTNVTTTPTNTNTNLTATTTIAINDNQTVTTGENKQVWESNFHCDYCPQSFANARWVIRHRKQHFTEENLTCQRCRGQFSRSADLGKHLAVCPQISSTQMFAESAAAAAAASYSHKPNSPEAFIRDDENTSVFSCDLCGQTYASARWVMRHRRSHSNGDSYICQNCHQVFARSVEISKHLGSCHLPTEPHSLMMNASSSMAMKNFEQNSTLNQIPNVTSTVTTSAPIVSDTDPTLWQKSVIVLGNPIHANTEVPQSEVIYENQQKGKKSFIGAKTENSLNLVKRSESHLQDDVKIFHNQNTDSSSHIGGTSETAAVVYTTTPSASALTVPSPAGFNNEVARTINKDTRTVHNMSNDKPRRQACSPLPSLSLSPPAFPPLPSLPSSVPPPPPCIPPPSLPSSSLPSPPPPPTTFAPPLVSQQLTARVLQCDFCPETFLLPSILLQHRKSHPDGSLPYQCPDCASILENQYELAGHLQDCPQKSSQPYDYSLSGNALEDPCLLKKEKGTAKFSECLKETSPKERKESWNAKPSLTINNSTLIKPSSSPTKMPLNTIASKDSYKCDYCSEGFPNASSLLRHRCRHTMSMNCRRCGKLFINLNDLAVHFSHPCSPTKKHSVPASFETKQYRCDFCQKEYGGSNWIMRHRRFHTSEKKYLCRICGYVASTPGNMAKHLSHCPWVNCKTSNNTKHLYPLPGHRELLPKPQQFKQEPNIFKNPLDLFRCTFCNEAFATESQMIQHQYVHMEINSSSSMQFNVSMKPLNLSVKKPSSSISSSANAEMRATEDAEEEPLSKPSADTPKDTSADDGSSVNNVNEPSKPVASSVMKQWNQPVNSKIFHCDFCGQAFASNNWVMRHRRLHTKESRYTCRNCGDCFDISHEMAVHLIVCKHTSTKGNSELPNRSNSNQENSNQSPNQQHQSKEIGFLMNNKMTDSSTIENHQENKIIYTCDFCGKDFGSNNWIIRHRKLHTQETIFECRVCGEGFVHSHQIASHLTSCRRPTKKDYKLAKRALMNSEALASSKLRSAGRSADCKRFLNTFPLCDFCGLHFPSRQLTVVEEGKKKCRLCIQQIHRPWKINQRKDSIPNSCNKDTGHSQSEESKQHLKLHTYDNVAAKSQLHLLPSLNQLNNTSETESTSLPSSRVPSSSGKPSDFSSFSSTVSSMQLANEKRKSSLDYQSYFNQSNEEVLLTQPNKKCKLMVGESSGNLLASSDSGNQQNIYNENKHQLKANLSSTEEYNAPLLPKTPLQAETSLSDCPSIKNNTDYLEKCQNDSPLQTNFGHSEREENRGRENVLPFKEEITFCNLGPSQSVENALKSDEKGTDAHSSDDSEYGSSLEKFAESLNLICKKSKFRCDFCEEAFAVAANLIKHRVKHISDTSLWCRNCRRILPTSQDLAQHLSWCRLQSKDSSSDGSLRQHNSDKMYKCDFCSQRFGHSLRVMKHRKDHVQEEGIFRCRRCDTVFYRSGVFADHLASCCLSRRTGYDSPRANGKTVTSPPMIIRNGTAHSWRRFVFADRQKLQRLFHCDFCRKTFAGSNWIMRHRRGHTNEMPYKCRLCSAVFIQPGCMAEHLLTCVASGSASVSGLSSGENYTSGKSLSDSSPKFVPPNQNQTKGLFRCDFCGRKFPSIKEGLLHRQCHNESFTATLHCRCCRKVCESLNDLGIHLTHCSLRKDKPNMLLHESLPANKTPKLKIPNVLQRQQQRVGDPVSKRCAVFACDICGKPFLGVPLLLEHRQSHAKEIDIHKCYNCREKLECPMSEHLLVCNSSRTYRNRDTNNNNKHSKKKSPAKHNHLKKYAEQHSAVRPSSSSSSSNSKVDMVSETQDQLSGAEDNSSETDDGSNTKFTFECCGLTFQTVDDFTNHIKCHQRWPRF
ncbi:uncharacterized protein LOC118766041 isoform X1 [Octopus sinensis]|uniref:Uncharacterized protein LOC118766041 isoform X1 n=1 Tax=Octopus sinensis TaxID=2607531 RepID=A0A7E6FBE3_9MOLL|nr:uncharacterized protein LOC118766041 isoform X1 [Octopus sinensis]XP_036365081.1 uncharacterized protein LOC118766041 isoform X1 [Octopus sinensis]